MSLPWSKAPEQLQHGQEGTSVAGPAAAGGSQLGGPCSTPQCLCCEPFACEATPAAQQLAPPRVKPKPQHDVIVISSDDEDMAPVAPAPTCPPPTPAPVKVKVPSWKESQAALEALKAQDPSKRVALPLPSLPPPPGARAAPVPQAAPGKRKSPPRDLERQQQLQPPDLKKLKGTAGLGSWEDELKPLSDLAARSADLTALGSGLSGAELYAASSLRADNTGEPKLCRANLCGGVDSRGLVPGAECAAAGMGTQEPMELEGSLGPAAPLSVITGAGATSSAEARSRGQRRVGAAPAGSHGVDAAAGAAVSANSAGVWSRGQRSLRTASEGSRGAAPATAPAAAAAESVEAAPAAVAADSAEARVPSRGRQAQRTQFKSVRAAAAATAAGSLGARGRGRRRQKPRPQTKLQKLEDSASEDSDGGEDSDDLDLCDDSGSGAAAAAAAGTEVGSAPRRPPSALARRWALLPVPARVAGPGRLWVLGLHLSPPTTLYYLRLRKRWLQRLGAQADRPFSQLSADEHLLHVHVDGLLEHKSQETWGDGRTVLDKFPSRTPALDTLEDIMVAMACNKLGKQDPTVREVVLNLPEDMPCNPLLEVYHEPTSNPIIPDMRGVRFQRPPPPPPGEGAGAEEAEAEQAFLDAAARSPLLGPYAGDLMLRAEWQDFKLTAPGWFRERYEAQLCARANVESMEQLEPRVRFMLGTLEDREWEVQVNSYAHDMDVDLRVLAGPEFKDAFIGSCIQGSSAEGGAPSPPDPGSTGCPGTTASVGAGSHAPEMNQACLPGAGKVDPDAEVNVHHYKLTVSPYPYIGPDEEEGPWGTAACGNLSCLLNSASVDPMDRLGLTPQQKKAAAGGKDNNCGVLELLLLSLPLPVEVADQEEEDEPPPPPPPPPPRPTGRAQRQAQVKNAKAAAAAAATAAAAAAAAESEPLPAPACERRCGLPLPVMLSLADEYVDADPQLYSYGAEFWVTLEESQKRQRIETRRCGLGPAPAWA